MNDHLKICICYARFCLYAMRSIRFRHVRVPDATALKVLPSWISHLLYCIASFSRLSSDFRTLLQPLLALCEHTCLVSSPGRWSTVVCAYSREDRFPRALVLYPPIAVLANTLLAALNGLRTLAPALRWVTLQTHSLAHWARL